MLIAACFTLATFAPVTKGWAGELLTISATRPLQDYCTLTKLPAGSCTSGYNFAIRETCPGGMRAVSVSCFIRDLSYSLAINATFGAQAICDWNRSFILGEAPSARIEVLCGNVPKIERQP